MVWWPNNQLYPTIKATHRPLTADKDPLNTDNFQTPLLETPDDSIE